MNRLNGILALRKLANHWNTVHVYTGTFWGHNKAAVVPNSEREEQHIGAGACLPQSVRCPCAEHLRADTSEQSSCDDIAKLPRGACRLRKEPQDYIQTPAINDRTEK